ncbi:MAG: hypothetical protein AB9869_00390 [Verrucomicrobiia bacterium]
MVNLLADFGDLSFQLFQFSSGGLRPSQRWLPFASAFNRLAHLIGRTVELRGGLMQTSGTKVFNSPLHMFQPFTRGHSRRKNALRLPQTPLRTVGIFLPVLPRQRFNPAPHRFTLFGGCLSLPRLSPAALKLLGLRPFVFRDFVGFLSQFLGTGDRPFRFLNAFLNLEVACLLLEFFRAFPGTLVSRAKSEH